MNVYKKAYLLFLSTWFFSIFVFAERHQIKLFELDKEYPSPCDDPTNPCYTMEDLVKQALERGLDSLEKIQLLYQARKDVKVKMGELLPQINPLSIATAAMDRNISIDTVIPLVGFLFPSRWYEWKASRHLAEAELESVGSVFADRTQAVQHLYFDIQMQIWSIRILEFYIKEIEELIEFVKEQQRTGIRQVTDADIGILENLKGKLIYDRAFIDALSAALPQLATAIGLSPNFDWSHLKIEPHNFDSLNHINRREYQEFWPDALARSTEVKNVEYLIEATKDNKRGVYFDFFDPGSGNELGFGYGSRIKISRSKVEVLRLALRRTKMQLSNLIQNSLNNYNDAVGSFPGIENGLKYLDSISEAIEDHVNDTSVPLDITRIVRHFKYAEGQAIRYTYSYFTFRIAEADLNRYTWRGKFYDIAHEYRIFKVPEFLEKIKKANSFRQRFRKNVRRKIDSIGECLSRNPSIRAESESNEEFNTGVADE